MHSYRKIDDRWQVVYQHGDPTGPRFDTECEAAAFACFLNGGRYSPGEIEHLFRRQPQLVEDDSIHPDRPKELDDYPLERKRG